MSGNRKGLISSVIAIVMVCMLSGCGAPAGLPKGPIAVNTYEVTAEEVTLQDEYSGMVIAAEKVPIRANVSGRIVEKYVQGGQNVRAGQPLFRLDKRDQENALAVAKAEAARAKAVLANQALNYHRYQQLSKQHAVSTQMVTDQESLMRQQEAVVQAQETRVRAAQDTLADTVIYAPFTGVLGVDDVPIGTYVTAGNTPVVTISSTDPVLVSFSLGEEAYLQWAKGNMNHSTWGQALQLRLSDGSIYPENGRVVQVNHSMEGSAGSVLIKASFANPHHILIPGLYGTVIASQPVRQKVLLVPQRAVQQTLGKYFISVVDASNKVHTKEVQPGKKYGAYWIIRSGIQAGDIIVVDGFQKMKGVDLSFHRLTKADIDKKTVSIGEMKEG